jgi:hypothetical protein
VGKVNLAMLDFGFLATCISVRRHRHVVFLCGVDKDRVIVK